MRIVGRILTWMDLFLAVAGFSQTPDTVGLTESGAASPTNDLVPIVPGAMSNPGLIMPALNVTVPNGQAPRMVHLVNPSVAIPFNSSIREIEAYWNGTPLPFIDPENPATEIDDMGEAHSFGNMIPFFKPLFSVDAIVPGSGTLEIRAFDSNHVELAAVSMSNLTVSGSPAPISTSAITSVAHPRIYLTASRLAVIRARASTDFAARRYQSALSYFTNELANNPDVLSTNFPVYEPENFIPLLGLTYQLRKSDDPALAAIAAKAAHTMVTNIARAYNSGQREFGADDGYNIRYDLRNLLLGYDWVNDRFTANETTLIVQAATNFVEWYHTNTGYAEANPADNYYAGYMQGIALTIFATAGSNNTVDSLFALLRSKLTNEVPVLNQLADGGDWPEGWNYGPYTVLQFSLLNALLSDYRENWSADFDWLQTLPRSILYRTAPDYSQTRSYGAFTSDYEHKTSPSMLAVLSSTTRDGPYAGLIYSNMNMNPNNDFAAEAVNSPDSSYEMIFASNTAPDLTSLPLSYFNSGSGRFFSRSSLTDPQAYFVSAENMTYTGDHFGWADGDVRIYQGTNCLVCPEAYAAPDNDQDDGENSTPAFSTYIANGTAQEEDQGRNNQNSGPVEAGSYAAITMRFESSWATGHYDENFFDPANPLDYMIRQAIHLRPGTLIVRDLHRRRHAADTLAAQFHLGPIGPVEEMPGGWQLGPLVISAQYPPGVSVSFTNDFDNAGDAIGTLMQLSFDSSTNPLELVTVFSETLSATSYSGGVLSLDNGTSMAFAENGTIAVTSSAPSLTIQETGGANIVLAWPSLPAGWTLEQNADLTTTNWRPVTATITNNGVTQSATVPLGNASMFFRLSGP